MSMSLYMSMYMHMHMHMYMYIYHACMHVGPYVWTFMWINRMCILTYRGRVCACVSGCGEKGDVAKMHVRVRVLVSLDVCLLV